MKQLIQPTAIAVLAFTFGTLGSYMPSSKATNGTSCYLNASDVAEKLSGSFDREELRHYHKHKGGPQAWYTFNNTLKSRDDVPVRINGEGSITISCEG